MAGLPPVQAKPIGVPGVPAPRPAALPNAGATIHGRALSTYSPASQARYRGLIAGGSLSNVGGRLVDAYQTPLFNPLASLSGRDLADAASALTNMAMVPAENRLNSQLHQAQNRQSAVSERGMAYYSSLLGSIHDSSPQAGGPMGLDNIYRLKASEAQDSIRRWGSMLQLPITQQLSDLEATRPDRYTTNLLNLRQQGLNSYITQGNLGVNQGNAQTRADSATEKKNNDWTAHLDRVAASKASSANGSLAFQAKTGYTPAEWAKLPQATRLKLATEIRTTGKTGSKAKAKGNGGLTGGQVNTLWGYVDAAKGVANEMKPLGFTMPEIRAAMTNGYYLTTQGGKVHKNVVPRVNGGGYSPYANAGMDLVFRQGLSPKVVQQLHRAHMNIGNRFPLLGTLSGNASAAAGAVRGL